jgi:hypothetical protein
MLIEITKDGGLGFFGYGVEGEGDHGSVLWPGPSVYSMVRKRARMGPVANTGGEKKTNLLVFFIVVVGMTGARSGGWW